MRKKSLIVILILQSMILISQEIKVGIFEIDADTYNYIDGKLYGDIGGKVQCILDNSGLNYTYIELPLKRLINMLYDGQIDIIPALIKNDVRDKKAHFSASFVQIPYIIVTKDPYFNINKSLKGKIVSTMINSTYEKLIIEYEAELYTVNDYFQSIQMVLNERAYAYIGPKTILKNFSSSQLDELNIILLGESLVGFYISPEANVNELDNALKLGLENCK